MGQSSVPPPEPELDSTSPGRWVLTVGTAPSAPPPQSTTLPSVLRLAPQLGGTNPVSLSAAALCLSFPIQAQWSLPALHCSDAAITNRSQLLPQRPPSPQDPFGTQTRCYRRYGRIQP